MITSLRNTEKQVAKQRRDKAMVKHGVSSCRHRTLPDFRARLPRSEPGELAPGSIAVQRPDCSLWMSVAMAWSIPMEPLRAFAP